jgi:hypothetical protein
MRPSAFTLTDPKSYQGKAVVYTLNEMLNFPPPKWLIEGLVPEGTMTGLVGAPGVGKSMIALDWALCVATGMPWLGVYPVQKGFALYIAAEGHSGLSIRARAWLEKYGGDIHQRADFGLVKDRLFVTGIVSNPDDGRTEYETLFTRIEDEMQSAPKLVVIDTLARCLEGDENESQAMGHFVNGAEQFIERYGSTVVVVHHKNAMGGRERGHSSFRGALGALHFLDKTKSEGLLALKTEKQRDARELDPIGLRQEQIGNSALFVAAELPKQGEKSGTGPAPMRKLDMLAVLSAAEEGYSFSEWRLATGIPRRTFFRRLSQLVKDGEVVKDPGNNKYTVSVSNLDIAELERGDD